MKILMTVHHCETKSEIANGSTFEECLAYLSARPLYKGYGPALADMAGLKIHGEMSFGWADYKFYNDEKIQELIG